MSARAFFDTNVLIYADDASAGAKAQRARELLTVALRSRLGVVSTQVLLEYYAVACRKLRMDGPVALSRVRDYAVLDVVCADADLVLRALTLHQRVAITSWDAMIVQAALDAGCTTLWSADMQDGQVVDGVRIRNPFV